METIGDMIVTEPVDGDSMVAIVGMSGRFPGAADVGELWRNLLAGTGGLREITDAELAAAGVDPAETGYVRVGGPVEGLEEFDAAAFGLSDREAETMEPHHRLLLECSWEALERAGYTPTEPGPAVGVFAGCAFPDYMIGNLPGLGAEPDGKQLLAAGVERDSLTSLVSYKLGLHGPSLTVQTYCSTSLVAVHLACQSLLTYECDMALAGGASLPLPQPAGYRYEEGGILSPDGRVRSLDADANGTVMGAGVAVVALKRLADALADGDMVHAVILGSAVNNDGRERAGYAAPGVGGQAAVIDAALAVAGVKPESVGYVECHAVGTPLGDSIELAALNKVFTTPRESPCVLSSVKPSIGHLDRAAGVTGLVRAALSLRHETLPAVPGFRTPNPALAQDRFTVLTENRHWPAGPDPRRAGVSSFGVGGTNAHVVLEQAPPRQARPPRSGPHLLTFSAGDPTALAELTSRLGEHLVAHPDEDLSDVAYTLGVSRGRFALRRAVVCRDHADAVAAFADPTRWLDGETRRRDPRVRLVAGDDVPADWLASLSEAVHRLLPSSPGGDPLAVLEAGLSGIGVRLHAEPGGEDVVVAPAFEGSAADWLLTVVARLWQAGAPIDWAALHRGGGRRVELPTYPFQRRRHWIEPSSAPVVRAGTHLPTWRLSPRPVDELDFRLRGAGPWLLFGAEVLAERLVRAGAEVVTVRAGASFESHETGDFTAHPGDLGEVLASLIVTPRTIVHGFSLATRPGEGFAAAQEIGAASVSALAEALAGSGAELVLLTSGATGVLGADLTHPEHAGIALESVSRHIDMDAGADLDQVLASMVGQYEGPVAVRGDQTWSRHHEPHTLAAPATPPVLPGDVVLVTGDGMAVASHLESLGATVLTGEAVADVDLVVHVVGSSDCAAVVGEFHALQAVLGDRAVGRRVVLCSSTGAAGAVVAAYATVARHRGQGRWVVAAGDTWDADLIDRVLAAGHLTHVVMSTDPAGPLRPAATGGLVETGERGRRPRPALATPFVEPDAGLEAVVADLVATGLGLETIGVDDNFFELGGRSAVAVQLAVRLRDDHAAALPLTALVEHPTVRLLCAEIAAMRG